MKLIKTASGKKKIKISKKEWQSIGTKAGWDQDKYDNQINSTREMISGKGILGGSEPSGTRGKISNVEIPEEAWQEAESISMGTHSANAANAKWYAFAINVFGTGIAHGEFKYDLLSDLTDINNFDGYIVL